MQDLLNVTMQNIYYDISFISEKKCLIYCATNSNLGQLFILQLQYFRNKHYKWEKIYFDQ